MIIVVLPARSMSSVSVGSLRNVECLGTFTFYILVGFACIAQTRYNVQFPAEDNQLKTTTQCALEYTQG
eukprot:4349970-Amphidinium_carterae.1